jgi:hypothetical protein
LARKTSFDRFFAKSAGAYKNESGLEKLGPRLIQTHTGLFLCGSQRIELVEHAESGAPGHNKKNPANRRG